MCLVIAALTIASAVVWLRWDGVGGSTATRSGVDVATAFGRFVPTSDYFDRLNSEEYWRGRRGGGSSSQAPAKVYAPPPSGVTRVPAGGKAQPATHKANEGANEPAKASQKSARPKDDDDENEGDDESPWTKEGSRGTYRTLCVRMCDGYFFPISFSTSKGNLARDAKVCERSCASPAKLFYHENPGQEPEEMEDLRGKPYKELKVAFLYRKQYDPACTCKPQPWDEAALARHRQFAEAADRRKSGGKKGAEISKSSDAAGKGGKKLDAPLAAVTPELVTLTAFAPAPDIALVARPGSGAVTAAIPGSARAAAAQPKSEIAVVRTMSGPMRVFRSAMPGSGRTAERRSVRDPSVQTPRPVVAGRSVGQSLSQSPIGVFEEPTNGSRGEGRRGDDRRGDGGMGRDTGVKIAPAAPPPGISAPVLERPAQRGLGQSAANGKGAPSDHEPAARETADNQIADRNRSQVR